MGKSILSKGKTVNEAVTIAISLLGAKNDEVDIEIVANESKGMMGLRTKPAIVRVTVRDLNPKLGDAADPDPKSNIDALEDYIMQMELTDKVPPPTSNKRKDMIDPNGDLAGKVWIQGGSISCKDAPDKYPMVSIGEGIRLFKNDGLVEKTFLIREDDILRVELEEEVQEPKWELRLSDNKMEAILKVIPGKRLYKRLKDKPPGYNVELEIEDKNVPVIIETGPIMEKLSEMGILSVVDFTEVTRACTSDEAGSFVIAKGTPPKPGKHGYFMPVQEMEVRKGLKEKLDGTIDYREIQEFPSVEKGQIIGVTQAPVPGIYGSTVTNEPVLPPEVKPMVIKVGKGTILVEEGTKVVATEAGQPEIKVKGQTAVISVIPKLMIGKDVDLHTGNVHFIGDIEISGSVQDGMLVETQGNVLINASVHTSKILAGNSVIVHRNVIASEITAGNGNILKAEINQILDELIEQLNQMTVAINQLSTVSAFKVVSFTRTGLGPLLKILCDGKFKSVHMLIKELIDRIKSCSEVLGEEWIVFSGQLIKGFNITLPSTLQSIDDLHQLIQTSKELHLSIMDSNDDQNCFIKAGFVHNSQLYSSGDISIVGLGSYNSRLHSGGSVEIVGSVRGGEIYGAKGVKIGETGSKGGNMTKIVVSKEATIRINKALEDTVIQIGAKTHKFMLETINVVARLDNNEQIIIS
jgi:predicted RNA-binding protein Jag